MSRFEEMRDGLAASAVLHTAIVLVILLGLPDFLKKEPPPEETAIAVKLVNLSELTRATQRNPKPVEKAEPTPPPPVPAEKPEPPKPDPLPPPPSPPPAAQSAPPSPPPPPVPEPPKPSPPPPPPPPTPDPLPAPKPPEPKPEPPKPEPPKPEPPKPEPPKPQPKPTPPKPDKKELAADDLLKSIAAAAPTPKQDTPPKPQKQVASAQASAQPNAPLGAQVTTAEKDAIVGQIEKCWNIQSGAKNAKDLVITMSVDMAPDGTPQGVRIDDQGRYSSDTVFRAAADAAVRAMRNPECVPLKMPAGKYDEWKSMKLTFNPKDIL